MQMLSLIMQSKCSIIQYHDRSCLHGNCFFTVIIIVQS